MSRAKKAGVVAFFLLALFGWSVCQAIPHKNENRMSTVSIQWFGHAFFLISDGVKIAIDPFQNLEGYPNHKVAADLVLVTHEHFDHNKVEAITGQPQIMRGLGERPFKGIAIHGIKTYHDQELGKKRGENTIFLFELEGIRFAHCGDLGHVLTPEQLRDLGKVDVLMIPVGGHYTIDAKAAWENVERIKPKIVIPMHYKQPFTGENFPIAGVEGFLQDKANVTRFDRKVLTLEKSKLPSQTQIYVLNYK